VPASVWKNDDNNFTEAQTNALSSQCVLIRWKVQFTKALTSLGFRAGMQLNAQYHHRVIDDLG